MGLFQHFTRMSTHQRTAAFFITSSFKMELQAVIMQTNVCVPVDYLCKPIIPNLDIPDAPPLLLGSLLPIVLLSHSKGHDLKTKHPGRTILLRRAQYAVELIVESLVVFVCLMCEFDVKHYRLVKQITI
jgi:hypothetical protein